MANQGELYFGLFLTSNTLLVAMVALSGFLSLAIIISLMRIYKKAGKPGISAIIPIWGQIVLFQIVGKPWWYWFVPILNIISMFHAYVLLAKKFGKGTGFGIGMIFLPMIFIPLLSFYDFVGEGDSKVEQEEPVYNPFNENNVEQVMPSTPIGMTNENQEVIVDSQNINYNDQNNSVEQINVPFNENNIEPVIGVQNEIPVVDVPEQDPVVSEPINQVANAETFVEPIIENGVKEENALSGINFSDDEIVSSNEENIVNQDIQVAINQKPEELKDVAFGSVPVIEKPIPVMGVENLTNALNSVNAEQNTEVLDIPMQIDSNSVETLEVKSEDNMIEQNNALEDMEMPEIAAKSCPACGVSLSADNKFCTSCGTQI